MLIENEMTAMTKPLITNFGNNLIGGTAGAGNLKNKRRYS